MEEEIKDLVINGKLIAKYCKGENVEGLIHLQIIHLQVIEKRPDDFPEEDWEEYIAGIVCLVEGWRFNALGYLNVDAEN